MNDSIIVGYFSIDVGQIRQNSIAQLQAYYTV